jgi:NhaP-type Na+/H+ or K+/H+ antiporter
MCGSCEIEETKVKIGEKCPPAAIGSLIGAFICSVSAPELSPVAGLIAIVVCGLTQRKNETRNRCKACGYLWKP